MTKKKRKRSKAAIAADARRTGRPTITGKPLTEILHLRVSKDEAEKIRAEAKRQNISVSALLLKKWRKG